MPEAKDTAMEALALAEKHNLPRVASDATTTIVGLDKKVPMEQLAAALGEAARRARETGAVNSELRALYLLGRGYQDRGAPGRGRRHLRPAYDRAVETGIPWAPWAFDARFQQAQIAVIAGHWDDALALTNVDGQSPPPAAEALLARAAQRRAGRPRLRPDRAVQAPQAVLEPRGPGGDLRRAGRGRRAGPGRADDPGARPCSTRWSPP